MNSHNSDKKKITLNNYTILKREMIKKLAAFLNMRCIYNKKQNRLEPVIMFIYKI